ncbi:S41 family peptidase [Belliella pelovolcani]|uniref:C-terminal processing protease CtpA/Prc, contains a PDZ domain n=1 Tax=Belliella pelovolcani TaxID=529505 RepID=A0A1N7NVI5_9BACT|nr:S41 family peptidase [Belliella pelovolcani]SIT02286.1 C-terminal processing protease CtpA/Prc, contains a PDZ domain [Belliella pelovolcani]
MKITLLFILGYFFVLGSVHAEKSISDTEKLAATAKVWGFLKYYHPSVAKGKFDWDQQLLDILPTLDNAETKEELSAIFLTWIESLGTIKLCKKCQEDSESIYFDKNFDLVWFDDEALFTKSLSEKLRFIEQNRYQGKPYYVKTEGRNATLVISNEKSYAEFDWTNKSMRLLSLMRYWNTIAYYYPHKYQLDTNWDTVLLQMIPKFSDPDSELDYHLAMLELVVKIDDSHGYFSTDLINAHFGLDLIPAAFNFIDDKIVITGLFDQNLAAANDLQIGDVISKIEGKEVSEVLSKNLKYIHGSNHPTKLKYAFGKIYPNASDSVEVEITREGVTRVRRLGRYPRDQFSSSSSLDHWRVIQDNIGYINLKRIDGKELANALQSLADTRGIIIDLRNYPKEFFGNEFKNFLGARNEVFTKVIKPDFKYPGRYLITDQKGVTKASKYKGKVILLVDEYTQSRAEFTAIYIQNGYNVTTIGSQTAGAGGMMIPLEFVGGYQSYFTSSGIFFPDMSAVQRNGVPVDYVVRSSLKGIISGDDEVIDKAVELILKDERRL